MKFHSTDRLFLTEEEGISFWNSRYEQWADDRSDHPVEEGYIPVTLRFTLQDVNLEIDEIGTKDAFADSFYIEEGHVPADQIEVYDGTSWVPLPDADINQMEQIAAEAATIEEVDGEEIVWPDYEVFIP
jgi:hypothetical protein